MVGDIFRDAKTDVDEDIQAYVRQQKSLPVGPESVANLVADLPPEDIRNTAKYPTVLNSYLISHEEYTSCLPSAERVFGLITNGSRRATTSSKGKFDALADEINDLPPDADVAINAAFGSEHGCVIVVRGDDTEILQSFAGRSEAGQIPAPLIDSFSGGSERKTFPREDLVAHLRASAKTKKDGSSTSQASSSQGELFGGSVAPVPGKWDRRPLIGKTAIQDRMKKKMLAGLKALNNALPSGSDTGSDKRPAKRSRLSDD
jgi:hypothetical protein